jgi:putative addiction module component (TIGR02574 family)
MLAIPRGRDASGVVFYPCVARPESGSMQCVAESSGMSRNPKDIAAEALELPLAARAELASQLLESLDDLSEEENDQLWAKEADRRYAEYKAGNIEAISADEVFARLRARKK